MENKGKDTSLETRYVFKSNREATENEESDYGRPVTEQLRRREKMIERQRETERKIADLKSSPQRPSYRHDAQEIYDNFVSLRGNIFGREKIKKCSSRRLTEYYFSGFSRK
mgnify:CR=1 FL=1